MRVGGQTWDQFQRKFLRYSPLCSEIHYPEKINRKFLTSIFPYREKVTKVEKIREQFSAFLAYIMKFTIQKYIFCKSLRIRSCSASGNKQCWNEKIPPYPSLIFWNSKVKNISSVRPIWIMQCSFVLRQAVNLIEKLPYHTFIYWESPTLETFISKILIDTEILLWFLRAWVCPLSKKSFYFLLCDIKFIIQQKI